MRVTYMHDQREALAFIEKAAKVFTDNLDCYTYTSKGIEEAHEEGGYLAIRWGAHNRAICLCKLDQFHEPLIYGDVMPEKESE